MKISIASDHAGYEMKEVLKKWLTEQGHVITDFGTNSAESCDYPDYAHALAKSVEERETVFGVVLCGSGNGVNMTVNKHQGIRSALCWNKEISTMARAHNDANICALPARYISVKDAEDILYAFLNTEFHGGRHQKRIEKIPLK